MATMKEKTNSKGIIFTNIYALLCDGHEFWGAGYGQKCSIDMIFPQNTFPSTTGFYFTCIPT